MGDSFLHYHPDGKVFVLLLDSSPKTWPADQAALGDFTLIHPHDFLPDPKFSQMFFQYSVVEAATAIKPSFLQHLFTQYQLSSLVYIDPDIEFFSSMQTVWTALKRNSILLTPHLLEPNLESNFYRVERDLLLCGIYNLGFLALRNSASTTRFLTWWKMRLEFHCRNRMEEGLFVDQKWVDFAPGMFGDLGILRHAGLNAAHWNSRERPIQRRRGRFYANNEPLIFYHFSGYHPGVPNALSKDSPRKMAAESPDLQSLYAHYRAQLLGADYERYSRIPYAFNYWKNGIKIPQPARNIFRNQRPHGRRNPFVVKEPGGFFSELLRAEGPHLPPLIQEMWNMRADVQAAYPDPVGIHRAQVMNWAVVAGWKEFEMDAKLGKLFELVGNLR